MTVYILEFSEPLHHAKFYVGSCASWRLDERLKQHRSGKGAKILRACCERGISFRVVATCDTGGRKEERDLKNRKETPRFVKSIKEGKRPGWRIWEHWRGGVVSS